MKSIAMGITLWASLLYAQTVINGDRTLKGSWDASGAASTRPVKTGTATPATCASGEIFFNTNAPAGQNLYLCQPDNTWTQLSATASTAARTDQSNTYAANTVQTFQGTIDASGAGVSLPAKSGTKAAMPSTCTQGAFYFATDAEANRKIYTCSSTNTWTQVAYTQGTIAAKPSTCGVGQIYFATDAVAGRNLYLCATANIWSQTGALVGGTPAANQMAFWSDANTIASDDKVTRDASGNLTASGNITAGSVVGGNTLNAGAYTLFGRYFWTNAGASLTCASGAVSFNAANMASSLHVDLNNQATCAITWDNSPATRQVAWVVICNGATTPTTTLTWPANVRGGMAAGGTAGQCAGQAFMYDEVASRWQATGPGSSWN